MLLCAQSAGDPLSSEVYSSGDAEQVLEMATRPSDKGGSINLYFHYTTKEGQYEIFKSGQIISGRSDNRVYVSPLPLSAEIAQAILFGNTRSDQGESVVVLAPNPGFSPPLLVPDPSIGVPGAAYYHPGTISNGKEANFIYVGPNPF
jgi:hypothetical protein